MVGVGIAVYVGTGVRVGYGVCVGMVEGVSVGTIVAVAGTSVGTAVAVGVGTMDRRHMWMSSLPVKTRPITTTRKIVAIDQMYVFKVLINYSY
jgi:hypothetical protein